MTQTVQNGTGGDLAREAQKLSAGRMEALFIIISQIQGHVTRSRKRTDLKAVMNASKPSIRVPPLRRVR